MCKTTGKRDSVIPGPGEDPLPSSPPTPSEVSQLWSFQRADSVQAPLGGHAPVASASVSTEGER